MCAAERAEAPDSIAGNPRHGISEELFLLASSMTPLVHVGLLIREPKRSSVPDRWTSGLAGTLRLSRFVFRRRPKTLSQRPQEETRAPRLPCNQPYENVEPTMRTRGPFMSLLFHCTPRVLPACARISSVGIPAPGHWRWYATSFPNLIRAHPIYGHFL